MTRSRRILESVEAWYIALWIILCEATYPISCMFTGSASTLMVIGSFATIHKMAGKIFHRTA